MSDSHETRVIQMVMEDEDLNEKKLSSNNILPKQKASLDTSFWINCYRVGLIEELSTYFQLFVCSEVRNEILIPVLRLGIMSQDAVIFQQKLNQKEIEIRNPSITPKTMFHNAEDVAITLAEEMGIALLIDNGSPHEYARKKGFKVVSTAAFIVFLFSDGKLGIEEAENKLYDLRGLLKENIIEQNQRILKSIGGV
jgi:hypothetical protein